MVIYDKRNISSPVYKLNFKFQGDSSPYQLWNKSSYSNSLLFLFFFFFFLCKRSKVSIVRYYK